MGCVYLCKKCSKCRRILPLIGFYKSKRGKFKRRSQCKDCLKEYREENKDYIREYIKKYDMENKDYKKEYNKKRYEKNKNHYKKHYEENKDYIKKYVKKYYMENRDHIKEYRKKYREENKNYYKEYYKKYQEENKNYMKERYRKYREENPDKIFNNHMNRRLREAKLGNGITKEQWLEMMNYFNWKCAYSNEVLKTNNRSIDHIIPLNNNGENEIWNCVPMYRFYNSSKKDKDMLEWYKEQDFYSEERLNKIIEWQIYAYEKYSNNNNENM